MDVMWGGMDVMWGAADSSGDTLAAMGSDGGGTSAHVTCPGR